MNGSPSSWLCLLHVCCRASAVCLILCLTSLGMPEVVKPFLGAPFFGVLRPIPKKPASWPPGSPPRVLWATVLVHSRCFPIVGGMSKCLWKLCLCHPHFLLESGYQTLNVRFHAGPWGHRERSDTGPVLQTWGQTNEQNKNLYKVLPRMLFHLIFPALMWSSDDPLSIL